MFVPNAGPSPLIPGAGDGVIIGLLASFVHDNLVIILNPPSVVGLATVAAAAPATKEPSSPTGARGRGAVGNNAIVTVGGISGAVVVVAVLVALEHGEKEQNGADGERSPGTPGEAEGIAAQVGVAAVAGEVVAHLDEGGAVIFVSYVRVNLFVEYLLGREEEGGRGRTGVATGGKGEIKHPKK